VFLRFGLRVDAFDDPVECDR
jgi:hypothetical protein